ncbi:hypothetical protein AAMO2058_000461200 [Amorphochlora amoebiformis]
MVWAKKYNACNPPKDVQFALCFVLELVDRPGRPVCGAEVFISGKFMKHNNNVGAVVLLAQKLRWIEKQRKHSVTSHTMRLGVCKAAGLEPIRAKELGSGKVADRKHSGFNFTTLNDRVREKSPARPAANYIRPKLRLKPQVSRDAKEIAKSTKSPTAIGSNPIASQAIE